MSAKIDGDQDKDAQNELNPPSSSCVGEVTGQLTSRPSDEDDDETDDEVWETVPSLPSAEETLEITIPQRCANVR